MVQPLEDALPELAASRRREVAPARAGDAGGADRSAEAADRGSEDAPAEEAGVAAACDQVAEAAISRIRGIVDARREVGVGERNDDAAVGRIRRLVRRLADAREVLDEDGLPHDKVEAVREGLKALDEERRSGDPLAATAREVLGLLAVADLPLPVLARALDEIRLAQTQGREAAAVLLERLRMVAELPLAGAGE